MTARTPLGLFLKAFNEYEENKKENFPSENDHPQRASLEFLCFAGTNWTSGVPIPQVSEAIGQQAFLDLDILVSMLKSLEKQHNGFSLARRFLLASAIATDIKEEVESWFYEVFDNLSNVPPFFDAMNLFHFKQFVSHLKNHKPPLKILSLTLAISSLVVVFRCLVPLSNVPVPSIVTNVTTGNISYQVATGINGI